METEKYEDSLKLLAKSLIQDKTFPPPESLDESIVVVLIHTLNAIKSEHSIALNKSQFDKKQASAISTFMWCIGHDLVRFVDDDSYNNSKVTELCIQASQIIFQFLDLDDTKELLTQGLTNYHEILLASQKMEAIGEYLDQVSKAVYCYVVTSDKNLLDVFANLFETILNSVEED